MKTREEREKELRALLKTQEGLVEVMKLYRDTLVTVGRPTSLGRIGLLACQMVPRIVEAEFPTKVPTA